MIVTNENKESRNLPNFPEQDYYPEPKRRKAKNTLPRKDRLLIVFGVLLAFCSFVIITYYCAQVTIIGYRINLAQGELTQLRMEGNDLYTKVSQLNNLENIEYIAVHKLGMVKPSDDHIIYLAEEPVPMAAQPGGIDAEPEQVSDNEQPNWLIRTFTNLVSLWKVSMQS